MTRFILVSLMVHATLFASIAEIETLYEEKNYLKVIGVAKNSTSLYAHARLHVLWGKSAEALGNDEEAMSAYERVLMLTPDNTTVRLELAKLYAKSDRDYLIKELSKDSENYTLTVDEKDTIVALMKNDDTPLSASVSVSVGYDSNINVSPADLELPNTEEEISTKFIRFQAALNYTYTLEDIENTYFKSGLALFSQNNEAGYFDLLIGVANVGIGYRSDSFNIYLPLKYSRIHYLNRDLMESIGVNPDFNYVLSSSLIGNINARYAKRNFIQASDAMMDDSVLGVGTGLFWLFDDNLAYVKASYSDYSAKHKEESYFIGKEAIEMSTGITYYLNDDIFLDASYRYRDTSYDNTLFFSNQKRNDEYHQIDLKLSRLITEDIEGSLSYGYASNNSNYLQSEYSKNIVMCNLTYIY